MRKIGLYTMHLAKTPAESTGVYVVANKPFVLLSLCLFFTIASLEVQAQQEGKKELEANPNALIVPLGAGAADLPNVEEDSRVASATLLPASTAAWVSVPNVETLREQFRQTNIGRLANDPKMDAFIDSLTDQFRNWANDKNVRLGLTMDDMGKLNAGEICVAGILPPVGGEAEPLGRRSHGLVILIDVNDSIDDANALLGRVNAKMKKAGANPGQIVPIKDVEVSKWEWQHVDKNNVQRDHTTLQAIVDGWLLASDNEAIFRDVIRRIKNANNAAGLDRLSTHPQFLRIAEETKIPGCEPHFRWYVDPFGYVKLAKAIAAEDKVFKQRDDNIADVLEQQGFDAIKAVGGTVTFANGDQDIVHRTFAHIPPQKGEAQARARGILDFRNEWKHELVPEPWVVEDASSYLTFAWNVEAAFENVGKVFDAFIHPEEEGDWDEFVKGFKKDLKVDLRELVTKIDNRFSMMSAIEAPVSEESERVVVGIRVKEDLADVFSMVEKMIGADGVVQQIRGRKVIVVDTTEVDPEPFELEDPVFGNGEEDEPEEEDEEPEFNLFAKRYFVAVPAANGKPGGYILLCNNIEYLNNLLDDTQGLAASKLNEAKDFKRVNTVLDTMVDPNKVGFRQFARTDKVLETNYEMLRQGKMGQSQTVLARLLNEMFKEGDDVREQRIDGTKMPKNYAEDVAPYLGPSGWAMETYTDGWRITGIVLKKNGMSEVVQKQEDKERR